MDDAVPQPGRRLFLQHLCIGIHDPVDGVIADGMRSDGNAGLMKESDHLTVDFGIDQGIAVIALVDAGGVLIPLLVDPSGPGASASIHVKLGSAGDEIAVA